MKALSIRQPWAWLIVTGVKPIENRKWQTPYRGRLFIHAALKHEPDRERDPNKFTYGAIIGYVDLVNIVRDHPSIYFIGPYAWVLKNPQRIEPIPLRGMAGLFDVAFAAQP